MLLDLKFNKKIPELSPFLFQMLHGTRILKTLHLQNTCFGDQCKFTSPMGRIWILNETFTYISWIFPWKSTLPFFFPVKNRVFSWSLWRLVATILSLPSKAFCRRFRPWQVVGGSPDGERWQRRESGSSTKMNEKIFPPEKPEPFCKNRTWFLYLPSINFQKKYLSFQGLF